MHPGKVKALINTLFANCWKTNPCFIVFFAIIQFFNYTDSKKLFGIGFKGFTDIDAVHICLKIYNVNSAYNLSLRCHSLAKNPEFTHYRTFPLTGPQYP